ncbi:MAG: DUF2330 domain-containing protein [Candidatus Subteraquimicrobiales bacterium]|nr:DUF2330 domain-containing protein [Candidatus Subteraquimicrobiales bacterium]
MRRFLIPIILILLLLVAPVQALADGGFFPPPDIDITEPTQKAVIFYSKGCEDLIIQVSYEGDVEDFAWVVPVPSMPEVKASYFEIFFELSSLTTSSYYYYRAEGGATPLAPAEVTVYEQKRVGFYDTATISSEDPEALINWLKENGYNIPEDAKDVINHYIKKNWYFVAMKIAEEKQQEMYPPPSIPGGVIHPVKFSFETDEIVYPLKISAINKGETEILLYVFADHKQEINGFETESANWIEPVNIQHFLYLKPFVKEKMFLTKLRATFKQSEIKDDIYLTQAADDKPLKPQLNWYIIWALLIFGVLLLKLGGFYYVKHFED